MKKYNQPQQDFKNNLHHNHQKYQFLLDKFQKKEMIEVDILKQLKDPAAILNSKAYIPKILRDYQIQNMTEYFDKT